METYWGFHAEQIGFTDFWRFAWQRRADLWRYLQWAGRGAGDTAHSRLSARSGRLKN
jgi:hypothetical protein